MNITQEEYNDIEELLNSNRKQPINMAQIRPVSNIVSKQKYTKADKTATLDDFIEMVKMIVTRSMKKYKAEFIPDEGSRSALDPSYEIDHPIIYYKIFGTYNCKTTCNFTTFISTHSISQNK